eukprot:758784-Hanusia_phi.AAC.4
MTPLGSDEEPKLREARQGMWRWRRRMWIASHLGKHISVLLAEEAHESSIPAALQRLQAKAKQSAGRRWQGNSWEEEEGEQKQRE